jgi:hypothetical protein
MSVAASVLLHSTGYFINIEELWKILFLEIIIIIIIIIIIAYCNWCIKISLFHLVPGLTMIEATPPYIFLA